MKLYYDPITTNCRVAAGFSLMNVPFEEARVDYLGGGHKAKEYLDINRWQLWEAAHWFPSCYVYLLENLVKPFMLHCTKEQKNLDVCMCNRARSNPFQQFRHRLSGPSARN